MQISTILVATDLSGRSDRAVERAAGLARQFGAKLHILHVVDDALPLRIAQDVRLSVEDLLQQKAAGFPKEVAGNVEIAVHFGPVWTNVLETAAETGADLIVLGTHRNRGLADLFRGTTLERVAKAARVPVLMVNSAAAGDYRHAVVGVDFSPASQHAAACAAALVPAGRVTLASAYHVFFREYIDRIEPGDSDVQAEKKRIERELKDRMEGFEKDCPPRPAGYQSFFIEGGAAAGLGDYAARKEADLICIGSHGRSWLARAFLGNTARELLFGAPCDVLVARS